VTREEAVFWATHPDGPEFDWNRLKAHLADVVVFYDMVTQESQTHKHWDIAEVEPNKPR
jgi:hypothetical protein